VSNAILGVVELPPLASHCCTKKNMGFLRLASSASLVQMSHLPQSIKWHEEPMLRELKTIRAGRASESSSQAPLTVSTRSLTIIVRAKTLNFKRRYKPISPKIKHFHWKNHESWDTESPFLTAVRWFMGATVSVPPFSYLPKEWSSLQADGYF